MRLTLEGTVVLTKIFKIYEVLLYYSVSLAQKQCVGMLKHISINLCFEIFFEQLLGEDK